MKKGQAFITTVQIRKYRVPKVKTVAQFYTARKYNQDPGISTTCSPSFQYTASLSRKH